FSTNNVELGFAQYPDWPGTGPRRGLPSGQRGAAGAGWPFDGVGLSAASASGDIPKTFFLLFVRTTEFPQICLLPSRAIMPCTVTASPGFTESRFQPLRSRSSGLSSSTAQTIARGLSPTVIRRWT